MTSTAAAVRQPGGDDGVKRGSVVQVLAPLRRPLAHDGVDRPRADLDGDESGDVGDTKYKLLDDDGSFSNADVYQLVTYCRRLGLQRGHLLYAGESQADPERYAIRGADTELLIHAFDLRLPLDEIESRIAALHGHLGHGAAVSDVAAVAG